MTKTRADVYPPQLSAKRWPPSFTFRTLWRFGGEAGASPMINVRLLWPAQCRRPSHRPLRPSGEALLTTNRTKWSGIEYSCARSRLHQESALKKMDRGLNILAVSGSIKTYLSHAFLWTHMKLQITAVQCYKSHEYYILVGHEPGSMYCS
jgi:hypothetical protein